MLLLPEIDAFERDGDRLRLRFVVRDTDPCFEGHFPDCSILPGVVQVGWAIEFARRHFPITARFRSFFSLKFMRVIQPDTDLALLLNAHADLSEVKFEYRVLDEACSSGRIHFQ